MIVCRSHASNSVCSDSTMYCAHSHGGNKNNRTTKPDKVFKKFCKLFRWYSYNGNQDNRATDPIKFSRNSISYLVG